MDIHIHYYTHFDTIEISAYDTGEGSSSSFITFCFLPSSFLKDHCRESQRIYCDKTKLFAQLNQAEVDVKVREKQEAQIRQRKNRTSVESLAEEVKRSLVGAYVLGRVFIVPNEDTQELASSSVENAHVNNKNNESTDDVEFMKEGAELSDGGSLEITCGYRKTAFEKKANNGFEVRIQALSGNEDARDTVENLDYIMPGPPEGLEPVFLARKKKTTHEDFRNSLRSFNTDTRSLSAANARAGKLAGLAKTAVEGFRASGRLNLRVFALSMGTNI